MDPIRSADESAPKAAPPSQHHPTCWRPRIEPGPPAAHPPHPVRLPGQPILPSPTPRHVAGNFQVIEAPTTPRHARQKHGRPVREPGNQHPPAHLQPPARRPTAAATHQPGHDPPPPHLLSRHVAPRTATDFPPPTTARTRAPHSPAKPRRVRVLADGCRRRRTSPRKRIAAPTGRVLPARNS